ncbi:hypothetical protein EDC04DRAFT_2614816 [Pisolithus marmoratus]|nr:hypothetical protein EDC04DRAFT_2614816 [Pisolithus marmoratus]
MHRCLSVYDILQLVFRCIEDRPTLCALAITCRTFNEPATDLIWQTLDAVGTYLAASSSARQGDTTKSSTTNRELVLSHPLSDSDWSIIRRLSSRVRRFRTSFPAPQFADNDVPQWFMFLASPPDPSFLFPNLCDLSIEVSSALRSVNHHTERFQAAIRFFHLLLRPHLLALRIDIPDLFYCHFDVSSIPVLCPNIRRLRIGGPRFNFRSVSPHDELGDKFSRVVSELCHLDSVESYPTCWKILSGLAQAKALRRLWLFLPRDIGHRPERPSGSTFPQLRTLGVCAKSFESYIDLFSWTSLNQVTKICMLCEVQENDYTSQALVDLSFLISSQCKHLEFLWFLTDHLPFYNSPPSWPRPMLECYQVYRQLRVIALKTRYSVTISDDDFEDMIKAWPDLEVFHLFHNPTECPPDHLTLRGVTALLHHCPKLKHFTLTFDATFVPERVAHGTVVRNMAVRYMGVHTSPVSERRDVAAYLSATMPSLEIIGIETALADIYRPKWNWIATKHQQKPVVRVDMSPEKLYFLLTMGTTSGSEHSTFDTGWYMKYRGGL